MTKIKKQFRLDNKSKPAIFLYSFAEEIANSITHGIGAILSLVTLILLIVFACRNGDLWRIASFSVFGAALFFVYLTSSIYHGITNSKTKHIFRILDHLAIYLLIAGTYTPVILVFMRNPFGWALFGTVWVMAVAGVVHEDLFFGKMKNIVSVLYYVIMGGLILFALKPLLAAVSIGTVKWLLIGGASYLFGLIFYGLKKMPYNHAIWHLFVMIGSAFHVTGIFTLLR